MKKLIKRVGYHDELAMSFEEFKEAIYDESWSKFPLDAFLNDIMRIKDEDYDKESAYLDIARICEMFVYCRDIAEKYEILEKELGCPVDVLLKALKNYIWIYDSVFDSLVGVKVKLCFDKTFHFDVKTDLGEFVYLPEYKTTWWLKEDKSE